MGAGIAAPVDRDGNVLAAQQFWGLFDVGLRSALKDLHGWTVLLENDANLAALGERWRGSGAGVDDLVVLLAGERLGAGVHGIRAAAARPRRRRRRDGLPGHGGGRRRHLRHRGPGAAVVRRRPADPSAAAPPARRRVFAAAAAGDAVALEILDRLAERMARVIASIASLINPELVVIGGAVAKSAGVLLPGDRGALPGSPRRRRGWRSRRWATRS